ncbi:MAG: zinc ribbon domain-containing protein [Candidatus Coatesbacteria bacterium]|nr:zinc ribbon domain-containing protein [Candidatus Coatesbacteria bacterium]
MPTYEYECLNCGHHFELFQGMSDSPVQECPKCRGKVRRVLYGGAGFILKGNGFYATSHKHAQASPSSDSGTRGNRASCDRTAPCCGRSDPCDKRPCDGK